MQTLEYIVTQKIVHSFRTVVLDSGANWGLIISSSGFQKGAFESAENTIIRLLTWSQFQELFIERWIHYCFVPRLREDAVPLVEYTEPINSRIFRKAEKLSSVDQERFRQLRESHAALAFFALPFCLYSTEQFDKKLDLPLAKTANTKQPSEVDELPNDILEAGSYREILDSLIMRLSAAMAEFDQLFGERAQNERNLPPVF